MVHCLVLMKNSNQKPKRCQNFLSIPKSIEFISSHSLSMASSPAPGLMVTLKGPRLSHYCFNTQKFLGLPAFQKFLEFGQVLTFIPTNCNLSFGSTCTNNSHGDGWYKEWILEKGCQAEDPTAVHYSSPKPCISCFSNFLTGECNYLFEVYLSD